MRLLDLQLLDIFRRNKSKYLIKRLGLKQPLLYFFILSLLSASSTVFAIKINEFMIRNSKICKEIKNQKNVQTGDNLNTSILNSNKNIDENIIPQNYCHMILNYDNTLTTFVITFLYMFVLYIIFYVIMAFYTSSD